MLKLELLLTPQWLLRLAYAVIIVVIAGMWLSDRPVTFGEWSFDHEPLLVTLAAFAAVFELFHQVIRLRRVPASERQNSGETPRDILIRRVQADWIDGVLNRILEENKSLRIDLQYTPEAILRRPDVKDYPLPDSTAVHEAYNTLRRKLLILGKKGAGKTVMVLQLTRELLQEASTDPKAPVPMIFLLSSWGAARKPFGEWLQDELRYQYGFSKKYAKTWVESERFVLLLDGLDEVSEEHRQECLNAIAAYLRNQPLEYVICSRSDEFRALTNPLAIPGEIEILPLSDAQITHYLEDDDLQGLRDVMKTDPTLQDFARTPFLLNTMAFVCRGERDVTLRLAADQHDPKSRRDHILRQYVEKRLDETPHENYMPVKTRRWLSWLAGQMTQRDKTRFDIEDLQPDWLDNKQRGHQYRFIFIIVVALAFLLTFGTTLGLAFGSSSWLTGELADRLALGLIAGLTLGLSVGLAESKLNVEMVDQLNWSFNLQSTLEGLALGLVLALILGLTGGLAGELTLGLIIGLVVGLTVALSIGLSGGLNGRTVQSARRSPNAGTYSSLGGGLLTVVLVGLPFGLPFGLAGGLIFGPPLGLAMGLGGGLVVGLKYGLAAVLKHAVIRFFLARDGHIPPWRWRYDHFLDYAANDLFILRKVGGGYTFIHSYLQDFFAESETHKQP